MTDPIREIANAVLYEGYILWPYRKSATKNQQRWTFGGVYPRAHSEAREDDPWVMQTQCLLEAGEGGSVEVSVRFLHVVERQVARRTKEGFEPVDELTVAGERHLTWQEAVERELEPAPLCLDRSRFEHREEIAIPAGGAKDELCDETGAVVGAVRRTWEGLEGAIELTAERLPGLDRLHRITVRILNATPFGLERQETQDNLAKSAARRPVGREEALRRTFCSAHTVVRARGGEFVSLTDPPERFAAAASGCRNEGTWPVLVGEAPDRSTLLSAPIILEDYPRIAPESPGDLFDGGEIDQLLVLNILSLTDEEKAEMRASDPRAREILERTEALGEEEMMRLHGAIREFGMARAR